MLAFLERWWDYISQGALPAVLLCLDVLVRWLVGTSLTGVGADLALASLAGLATLSVDEASQASPRSSGPVLFVALIAFVLWVATLEIGDRSASVAAVMSSAMLGVVSFTAFGWLLRDVLAVRREARTR